MAGKSPITPPADLERARLVAASFLVVLALIAFMLLIGTPKRVDLSPDALSAQRIALFQRDVRSCQAALGANGFETAAIADLTEGRCGYDNAVELTRSLHPYSDTVATSCALAAALAIWERDVLTPAAERHLGQPVARINLAGPAYACRAVAGRADRRLSEHAHANAIDIGGFTLADGRVISVAQGWRGPGRDRAFLRAARDGACDMFEAVLSPDYNRAHRDHLHFDLGRDKMCR